MKSTFGKIILLILILNLSCKSQNSNFLTDRDLEKNLNLILSTFVENELDLISEYSPNKENILLFVSVNRRQLIRNSKIHLNVEFWEKEYIDEINSNYKFDGIDIIFTDNKFDYVNVFNLEKRLNKGKEGTNKEVDKSTQNDIKSKIRVDITQRLTHPFAEMDLYLNLKNEITYISNREKMYYDLLKDKINFNDQFWDEIEIKE